MAIIPFITPLLAMLTGGLVRGIHLRQQPVNEVIKVVLVVAHAKRMYPSLCPAQAHAQCQARCRAATAAGLRMTHIELITANAPFACQGYFFVASSPDRLCHHVSVRAGGLSWPRRCSHDQP